MNHIHIVKPLGIAIIISTVICVSLVAANETVNRYTLIHWPSAVMVLGMTLGVLMVWQPLVRWQRFFAFLNHRSQEFDGSTGAYRQRSLARFLTAASRSALIAGLAGELLGIIMILTAARNPAAMEPGISIATVSLLYGLLLSELVFHRMRKRIAVDVPIASPAAELAAPRRRLRKVGGTRHAASS